MAQYHVVALEVPGGVHGAVNYHEVPLEESDRKSSFQPIVSSGQKSHQMPTKSSHDDELVLMDEEQA